MSDEKTTPGSADALLPTVGFGGVKGYEQVEVKGNRLDNLAEAQAQTRQIIAYRARFSDTFSDAVLWCCASGTASRLVLITVRNEAIPPIYPLGAFILVVLVGGVIGFDTIRRYPAAAPAAALRGFYLVFGLLSTLL